MGIVGRGIILALPHIKNMETTRKQGHNLPSKRLIDRPKERKTPYVNRVGINHDNRKSLLSGLAVLLCSADYERVKRVFSPEHLEAAWEAGKQLRRSVNWEGNGKRVYLQVKL